MKISTIRDYENSFTDRVSKNALDQALDIRKFEIELYWKRAAYFWSLITAAFAGYFALITNNQKDLSLIVACIGFILSFSWYLVNRGSKYWQSNWERHVDCLEDKHNGPLYKTIVANNEFSIFKFWSAYPFSVSRINQLVSLYISVIWLSLLVRSLPEKIFPKQLYENSHWLLIYFTFLYIFILILLGKGHAKERPRKINFIQNPLKGEAE